MREAHSARGLIRFGEFEVDVRAGELRKGDAKLKLQKQPFQILEILLERVGQVVSREELRQCIWPADTFVDFDQGLSNAIKRLREALSDSAETPRFIETIPRRGYRFIETINALTEPGGQIVRSIAVLPFLNLSADPENDFFCDGTTEEIISALSRIQKLHVVARTSAFAFKGKHVDVRTVGQQLNVQTILEGSIRKLGNRLRITAQLANVADGYHLWSEKYDREMKDVFTVQEEIADSIAQHLELSLDSGQQSLFRSGTTSLEAFKFYTQGRSRFFRRGVHLFAAVECFKKAVSLDAKYGMAWSGLADSYNSLGFYGLAKPEDSLPQAKAAAMRAIALDPLLGEAHTSLALSLIQCDWDRAGVEREFLRALELKSQNPLARCWYGVFYLQWASGRFDEGLAQAERAAQIDPLSSWFKGMLGVAYLMTDANKSLTTALEAIRIDADAFLGHWVQMTALNVLERYSEAAQVGEMGIKLFGRPVWMMASLARSYLHLGRRAESEALYEELCSRAKREFVSPVFLAIAACAAGQQEQAIRIANYADEIGDPTLMGIKYWPDLAELREDPRFQETLKRRGWT